MIFFSWLCYGIVFYFHLPTSGSVYSPTLRGCCATVALRCQTKCNFKKNQQTEKYCKSKHYNRSWIKCKRSRKKQQQNLTKHNRNVSGVPITWWTSWGSDRNQKNVNDCNGAGLKQDHQGCEGFFLFPLIFIQLLLCFVCFCSSFLFASDFLSCSTFDLSWLP